jgi:hypothetical protein
MPIQIFDNGGVTYFTVDGPELSNTQSGKEAKYAVTMDVLRGLGGRKQFSSIAQLYGLVVPGLILSEHLFQGLNRNLYCDEGLNGDEDKFVFSRKPAYDFYWEGGITGTEEKCLAPANQVFVVLISKNINHKDKFPDVSGWVERWNWVDEDSELRGAPINWLDRYNDILWSKK